MIYLNSGISIPPCDYCGGDVGFIGELQAGVMDEDTANLGPRKNARRCGSAILPLRHLEMFWKIGSQSTASGREFFKRTTLVKSALGRGGVASAPH